MKRKIILWCAEYLVYIEAGIVLLFIAKQKTVMESIIQIGTIGILTIVIWYLGALLKFLIRKERPEGDKVPILRDRYSFPSMHAVTVISASTYVLLQNIYLGVAMYVIAFLLMYSRVKSSMHYWIDMIGGVLIGVVITVTIHEYIKSGVVYFLNMYLW